jgi:hypothetical protein
MPSTEPALPWGHGPFHPEPPPSEADPIPIGVAAPAPVPRVRRVTGPSAPHHELPEGGETMAADDSMPDGTGVSSPALEGDHSAVLDEAHLGDIQGAFGTIRQHDLDSRRSWRARLLTLLAIMGPGLIVMVGDNDAGGVVTYAQAGQNFGLTLLWTLPLLIPVLIVNQEMVVRLGAVTGVGHARLINERFGRFWGAFSVGDLFILNFLTIATEFIGVSLALHYFGVSQYISVPIAAVAARGHDRHRQLPAVGAVHVLLHHRRISWSSRWPLQPSDGRPRSSRARRARGAGGFTSTSVLLIIAIVGTTVAPWQLFFQQSNIVDKRITPRWINYERADTVIGSLITVFAASLIMAICCRRLRRDPAGRPLHRRRRGGPGSTTTSATPPVPSSPSSC